MITYTYPTFPDSTGAVSGLSAVEVAIERLTHDGHTYEMRRVAGAWCIYASERREVQMRLAYAGGPLVSYADTEDAAWAELAPRIISADWSGVPQAMTDADYQAMLREIAAEEEAE